MSPGDWYGREAIFPESRPPRFPQPPTAEKSLSGTVTETCHRQTGFSLIEILVAIIISSILIGIIGSNFPSLRRIANTFLEQTLFEEQYLIFLLKLEDEYQQAEILDESDQDYLDQLVFRQDNNLDGDYLDSGELISYRWNKAKQRIDRKSGKAYFQALLDGISYFSWNRTSSNPNCHQLKIKDVFHDKEKMIDFCKQELSLSR